MQAAGGNGAAPAAPAKGEGHDRAEGPRVTAKFAFIFLRSYVLSCIWTLRKKVFQFSLEFLHIGHMVCKLQTKIPV